ncbi:VWA domain-containing protein [Carboxylicivirga sp. RSCT41]|uniref:VWA domain-containing protein n=1 Tax=Carboxylicivirga agarovorans TaxID=3417570 RepID=UPI003D3504D6
MSEWLDIDLELFHFLRPQYIWLFLPLMVIILIVLLGNSTKNKWQHIIASSLRPYMIAKGSRMSLIGPLIVTFIIGSLMIVAASGPTWKMREVPGAKSETILLIALDLSPSMLVDDVSPNRLERAKFKIRDLLDANPGSKVGLMAYAGTAHPVVTPCRDYKLISYQLESLQPNVMPLGGTRLANALNIADSIFSRTEAPCTLLLISDEVTSEQAGQIKTFVANTRHSVELMPMATPQGGRIPGKRPGTYARRDGQFVISKLNTQVLFELQKHPSVNVNSLTLDKEDVSLIAEKVRKNLVFQQKDEDSEEDWQEMGFVLLWPALVLFAFWFRKGWMIQWCLALVLLSSCDTTVESWDDLWYTKDYQAQRAYDNTQYELAAEGFEAMQNKGAAYYKAGNYEAAIELFKQDSSATSLYNLGLAYAASGQIDMAQEALLLANQLDPSNRTISEGLKQNSERMRQVDSLRSVNPDEAIELEDKEEPKGELNERRAKGEDEELTSDTEVDELPQEGDRVTDEVETDMRKAEELERPPEDFQPQAGETPQNILLREISADPSEFLRRRFKYQYEKYYSNEKQPDEPW